MIVARNRGLNQAASCNMYPRPHGGPEIVRVVCFTPTAQLLQLATLCETHNAPVRCLGCRVLNIGCETAWEFTNSQLKRS